MAKHYMGRDGPPLSELAPEEAARLENLRNRHFAEVGRIASYWALLELNVDGYALALAGHYDRFGICFTSQASGIGRKLAAYSAVAKLKGADTRFIRRLNKLTQIAIALSERRNRAVHDPWSFSTLPIRFEATARSVLKYEFIPVPTEELERLADDITDLSIAFDVFGDELMRSLGVEWT